MRKLLLTNLLAVAIISTVDESINSRYSRRKLRRIASWSWSDEENQLEHSAGRLCVVISADEATVDSVATQRYPDAIDEPDASNSSTQLRAYLNQLLLINQSQALHIQSQDFQAQRIEESVTQLRLLCNLRSLGVLTAAGCGIGSVHAVVRSNLLVEPSEVEEGEM
ncbi:hypothetical protein F511_29511 [Dorcoceras hygrometricum]|uniref:Uncharacterized protein n=1 Tax=Dorcoceras hygrometricum TaxID=472368 RepID=A0A2Z7CS26_9LAMI|nr:hypothetical protein F511_29511 [Dorcoceras hygrometricum]